ncbi:ATP-grasp domain-containing protein [Methylomonas sp. SURF-2]|uniref:ATP-grasp domain-containing protein n=1 Tax=Methylomonas subterranea TaxID=2952225 RepID=A0ABT1TJP3_9GAMM|nr:ATP-grasp domain-containing protein [Methylomonas sp. SURF-2]MCQ8105697.1 ATP-grasp domain-containing protein [Methylomonas sp. SURF-2]
MKILVFEYVSGGGLAGQDLPASLLAEGRMMLQALLDDLKSLPNLHLLLPLDERCADFSLPANTQVVPIKRSDDIRQRLSDLIERAGFVWLIAPESGGLLAGLARMVVQQRKILLLSPPDTLAICADKLATYRCLSANGIPAVETLGLAGLNEPPYPVCVIKPIDGVGCEGSLIVENPAEYSAAVENLPTPEKLLIQPMQAGQAISLSCLFKRGRGWLLCRNRQQLAVTQRSFNLRACLVNADHPGLDQYQDLVDRVARALPGLWGYIGIDIIETPDRGPLILEINPRLTTSYVGIRRAIGINVVEQVFRLLDGDPFLCFSNNQEVRVDIQ